MNKYIDQVHGHKMTADELGFYHGINGYGYDYKIVFKTKSDADDYYKGFEIGQGNYYQANGCY